jgi:beta-glucanase (GH16 family)
MSLEKSGKHYCDTACQSRLILAATAAAVRRFAQSGALTIARVSRENLTEMRTCPLLAATLVLGLLAAASRAAEAPETLDDATHLTLPGKAWKLLWHDEFSGASLDDNKWQIGLPWRGDDGDGRHHNDLYASYIVDKNVVVEGDHLQLLTRREDVIDKKGRTFHFTEGLITTAKSFRHRYGYWEARVKIPVEAGPGLWPAFWTLAEGWPPEMDICEVWTSSNRNHQGYCYRAGGRGKEKWDDIDRRDAALPTDWTTFGMEWGPGYQIYNVNARITKRVYGDHVTSDEHYIILNSGVESAHPPTAATTFPNAFLVDYVRVYDRPDVAIVHNGGFEDDGDAGIRPWNPTGQVVRIAYGAHDGTHALRLDGPAATAEQKIFGLKPDTKYILSGWVRQLSEDTQERLGVKEYGGSDVSGRDVKGGEYQQVEIEFTTGATSTTATVYCSVASKLDSAVFDNIALRKAD